MVKDKIMVKSSNSAIHPMFENTGVLDYFIKEEKYNEPQEVKEEKKEDLPQ